MRRHGRRSVQVHREADDLTLASGHAAPPAVNAIDGRHLILEGREGDAANVILAPPVTTALNPRLAEASLLLLRLLLHASTSGPLTKPRTRFVNGQLFQALSDLPTKFLPRR